MRTNGVGLRTLLVLLPMCFSLFPVFMIGITGCSRETTLRAEDYFDGGVRVLCESISKGNTRECRQLCETNKLLIAAAGKDGVTPLMWALMVSESQPFEFLLEMGADATVPNTNGDTVVHMAARMKDTTFLRLLVKHGVDLNVQDPHNKRTALFASIEADNMNGTSLLIKSGCDIDARDRFGESALMWAASVLKYEFAAFLVDKGASVVFTNTSGETLSTTVTWQEDHDVVIPRNPDYEWFKKVKEAAVGGVARGSSASGNFQR